MVQKNVIIEKLKLSCDENKEKIKEQSKKINELEDLKYQWNSKLEEKNKELQSFKKLFE